MRQETGRSLGFSDLTPIAAVVFLACALFLVLIGRKWLPGRQKSTEFEERLVREYLTEVMVTLRSRTEGKTLDEIPWAKRSDCIVLEVIREGERLPASGWLRLQPEDVLVLQGPVPTISQLLRSSDFTFKQELHLDRRTLGTVDLVTVEALDETTAESNSVLGYRLWPYRK